MIYVVLGMHKSGTSLVSQTLHHSGINMVDKVQEKASYEQGNHYERESTQLLNLNILNASNQFSLDILPLPRMQMSAKQREKMQSIIQTCNNRYQQWGFKEPTVCLTYPLWASELPAHKIIAIYRSPVEIWQRYRFKSVRHSHRAPLAAWRFINRWSEYNLNIINYLKATRENYIVISYEDLITTEAEFERLQAFVNLPLKDFRDPKLYHYRSQELLSYKVAVKMAGSLKGYNPTKIINQLNALRSEVCV